MPHTCFHFELLFKNGLNTCFFCLKTHTILLTILDRISEYNPHEIDDKDDFHISLNIYLTFAFTRPFFMTIDPQIRNLRIIQVIK